MQEAIRLPPFGEGVASAEIICWLVAVGETVERGQDVLEVQTTKAALTVAAPVAGELTEQVAGVGDEVAVGEVLGYLKVEAPATKSGAVAGAAHEVAFIEPAVLPPDGVGKGLGSIGGGGFLSPRSRSRIDELGLSAADLAGIRGTGGGGRVTADDIERFLLAIEPLAHIPAEPARLAIADAMRRSWQRPLATVARVVDVDPVLKHRRTVVGRPNMTVYAVRALAMTLAADKRLRQRMIGRKLFTPAGVGIGVAVAVGDAVLTPVVAEAHQGSLEALSARIDEAVEAARHGRAAGDATQGVATVSNYGALGLLWATPIPPAEESSLLGVGAVRQVPRWNPVSKTWDRGAEAELTLTFDHRIADGAAAARVLHNIARLLEHPAELL